jgi:hypothetical protein
MRHGAQPDEGHLVTGPAVEEARARYEADIVALLARPHPSHADEQIASHAAAMLDPATYRRARWRRIPNEAERYQLALVYIARARAAIGRPDHGEMTR